MREREREREGERERRRERERGRERERERGSRMLVEGIPFEGAHFGGAQRSAQVGEASVAHKSERGPHLPLPPLLVLVCHPPNRVAILQ